MVQIVENWSDVQGRVEAVEQAPAQAAPLLLKVQVEAAQPVDGYPNLLADCVGRSISLRGEPPARVPAVGELIRARVRKAGPSQYFYLPESLSGR